MNDPPHAPAAPTGRASLADRATGGFAWLMVNTVGNKVVGFLSQVALAYLLLSDDFGLYFLALTVTSVTSVFSGIWLNDVLVRRNRRIHLWIKPAFSLAFVGGVLAMGVSYSAAPLAQSLYDKPVAGLILVISLALPLESVAVVPQAVLRGRLAFRTITLIASGQVFATALISVGLALLDFAGVLNLGPFALALARPIASAGALVAWWRSSRIGRVGLGGVRRWRYFFRDGLWVFVTQLVLILAHQSDYLLIGIWYSEQLVGLYGFAFNLSRQFVQLVSSSIQGVMFPTLAQIAEDSVRQARGLMRAVRLLAVLAVPMGFFQAAVSDPMIKLIYPDRWHDAIPMAVWLSAAMGVQIVSSLNGALFQAQGRFRTRALVQSLYAFGFISVAGVAAYQGGPYACARALAVYFVVTGPLWIYLAVRTSGVSFWSVLGVFAGPVLFGAASAIGASAFAGWIVPEGWHVLAILVIASTMLALYLPVVALTQPEEGRQIIDRCRLLVRLARGKLERLFASLFVWARR